MKKKVLSLLLVAAMATSMVACGGEKADNSAANTEAAADNTADAETPAEEAWEGTITVWSPQEDQDTGWLDAQCQAFAAEHPNWNITFDYGVCAEGDVKTNVVTDVEAAADVYMLANDNIPDLVASNALAELGGTYLDYVTTTNSESITASVTYGGSVYAFPFTSNTWYMYYDTSVFTEEDIASLDAMLAKGKVAFPLNNSWYFASFYAANGCTLFGDGTDEAAGIDFSGDKAVAVTNYLVDLAANPNFVHDESGAGIAGLREGTVSAMFSGTWDAEAVKEALGDKFGVAALPTIDLDGTAGQMKSFVGSKAIGVNPTSENMQISMALAAYLAGESAQTAHYEMRNILPTNVNIVLAEDPIATAVTKVMTDTSIMQPLAKDMGLYWDPATNMANGILSGDVTHDNAAEKTEEMNTAMNTDVAQ